MYVLYHGYVTIQYWEYLLSFLYVVVLYTVFARRKNLAIRTAPEYRYFLWGLWARMAGGVAFSLIYFYYYKGGDTMAYFYSGVAMSKLATSSPLSYLIVLFSEASPENRELFTEYTGYPFSYVYYDPRTFFVVKVISPLVVLSLNSYLVTTVVIASLSYGGVWRCYRTFVSYYPSLMGAFAVAFLFVPSVVFWGSGIMKDTVTFSAACWWVHCWDEIQFKKRGGLWRWVGLVLSAMFLIVVKPYVFMVLLPVSLLWSSMSRVRRFRNALVRALFLPVLTGAMVVGAWAVLTFLGDRLDKFSLDQALETISLIQGDMKRVEQYGTGYFDVGDLDATWTSVLSKAPMAVNAALFRPYIWEAQNVVMAISGLENLWLLALALLTLFRVGPVFMVRCIREVPLVVMCILFSIVFAFVIGISTPNFGALVRFKIPLIPFFISGLAIIRFLHRRKREAERAGKAFKLEDYIAGDPLASAVPSGRAQARKGQRARAVA